MNGVRVRASRTDGWRLRSPVARESRLPSRFLGLSQDVALP